MAAVLSNDASSHKSRHHAHSKIPIHSTRRKTRTSAAVDRSPKDIPSIRISSTVPITPVPSTITISSSSPDYNESWSSREQTTPPALGRSLFHDEKQPGLKEDIDTTLSLSTSSLQSSPPTQALSHMEQKYDQTLTERTQQLIDSSTALIKCPGPNISLHHKEPSASPPPPCVEEGDILQQWRLRRRLEEARRQVTASNVSHLDKRAPHHSVPKKDVAKLYESRPSCNVQQETCISRSHNSHPSQNYHHESHHPHEHHHESHHPHESHNPHEYHHESHNPHDHHHKYRDHESHNSHDHHHNSHTSQDHDHESHHPHDHHHKYRDYHHKSHNSHTSQDHHHNSHAVQNRNASSACNVEVCRHISEQRNKKRSTNKKERLRESSELQERPMEQKEMLVKDERQFKNSSWKEDCVRYPLSLSGSDDDTSWDTDTLITDNTSPPPHSSSPAEDVSLTQLLAETVQQHLYGTPPPADASLGVPSHIYPSATPCPQVDNHLKDDLLAELFKRALSLSKTISEVDRRLAAMDTA